MLRTDRAPAEPQISSGERGPGGGGDRPRVRTPIPRKVRRRRILILFLALLLVLSPVWWSLAGALGNPAFGTTVSARFAEWAREHGAAPAVAWAEKEWYSHHQPPKGGEPRAGAIPGATERAAPSKSTGPGLPAPARVVPPVSPALPNEGTWHPVARTVDGAPAVYEAFVRPDAVHTSLVVGVAWMDTKLLEATLYSGNQIPGGGPYTHTAPIPTSAARSLVAAFNSGFRMSTANGGYYTDGHTIVPLRNGAASFVVYANGSSTVGMWGRDVTMTRNVAAVRQNLDLLVTGGKAVPGLGKATSSAWGVTVGGGVYVARSGLGVTADGALVYVGGPGLNITTLANLLVRAGAVRAMELDINQTWVNYATYAPSTPSGVATPQDGTNLRPQPTMSGTPSRYFQSWWQRDFITMSADPSGTAHSPGGSKASSRSKG
ncbi:MAG: phosphodiester glycosidase family protein [Acidimicrobiales bacterium]